MDKGVELEAKEFQLYEAVEVQLSQFVDIQKLHHHVKGVLFIAKNEEERHCYEVHTLHISEVRHVVGDCS